jgi:hypothetical protein
LRFALIAARLQVCQCFISALCCEQVGCFAITLGGLTGVKCLLDAIQEAVQVRKLLVAPLLDLDCLAPVVTGFHDFLLCLCLNIGDQLFPSPATVIADFFLDHTGQPPPDASTDSAEQKQQDGQGHCHAASVLADFAFELLQLELEFPDFAAQFFSISHLRSEDLALGNLGTVGPLQALKLFALGRGLVVREVLRADEEIQPFLKLSGDVGFHLRVGAVRGPFGQR